MSHPQTFEETLAEFPPCYLCEDAPATKIWVWGSEEEGEPLFEGICEQCWVWMDKGKINLDSAGHKIPNLI